MTYWLIILHLLSITGIFLTSISLSAKLVLFVVVLTSFITQLSRQMNFAPNFIRYSLSRGWEFSKDDGNFYPIEILPSTVITRWVVMLHYKAQNKANISTPICRDALSNDDYRKLLVALKIYGLKKEG